MLFFGYAPVCTASIEDMRAEVAKVASGETQEQLVEFNKCLHGAANTKHLLNRIKQASFTGNGKLKTLAFSVKVYNVPLSKIKQLSGWKLFLDVVKSLEPDGVKIEVGFGDDYHDTIYLELITIEK